jgi:hypothetical protein
MPRIEVSRYGLSPTVRCHEERLHGTVLTLLLLDSIRSLRTLFSLVLTGWDGSNPLYNPTDLFYQIVDRYSDTIANIFYGHTHEDFFNVSRGPRLYCAVGGTSESTCRYFTPTTPPKRASRRHRTSLG